MVYPSVESYDKLLPSTVRRDDIINNPHLIRSMEV